MKTFKLNIEDKKVLVGRLGELTGIKPKYTFMPRCAYEIGPYTVERNGDLTVEDGADEGILRTLLDEGLITDGITVPDAEYEQEAEEESAVSLGIRAAEEPAEETAEEDADEPAEPEAPDGLTISLPMTGHTAESLRRMVNLLYSRGRLLSKATGGSFGASKDLIEALDDAGTIIRAEDFISIVKEHGGLTGLAFDGKVSFTGFPLTDDPDRNKAFQQLACLMNRHALEMKRIQAKEVNDNNEKYAFRIWLLRLGMNTDEYKTARRVLMENLSGHTAFRTKAEEEKWKANQKAKREALKAAKADGAAEAGAEGTAAEG